MLHIKLKGITNAVTWWQIFCPQSPPPDPGDGVNGKKEGKDQESIQSSTTPDPGKVTTSQFDITNESQEVSPFPASDHKALINRRAQKPDKTRDKQHK